MQTDFIEVRLGSDAYEVRADGTRVEYAAGDRFARLRALGCPDSIIERVRTSKRKFSFRSTAPVVKPPIEVIAAMQGWTVLELLEREDAARRSVAKRMGRAIHESEDRDRHERSRKLGAVVAADAAQQQADNESLRRGEDARGIVFGRRSKPEKQQSGSGTPDTYPYTDLAAACKAQLGHALVGANTTQAYTKNSAGEKFTYDYSQDSAGKFSFSNKRIGGHPAWYKGLSAGTIS
jgi:hypothetical protein